MRRGRWLILFLLLAACRREAPPVAAAPDDHGAEVEAWRAQRDARLRSETGWLTLVNLAWLEPGENSVGAAPDHRVVLAGTGVPDRVGTIVVDGARATFRPAPGAEVRIGEQRVAGPTPLVSDDGPEAPTTLAVGSVRFHLISRNGKLAVRVRDTASPVRAAFQGMEYFPIDPMSRIVARFEPYDPPKHIPVPNVFGWVDDYPAPGVAVFEMDGATYRLEPVLEPGETDYFFIFGDRTNGRETYGGGRFLYSKPVGPDGTVVLDFNKSYNPPCVFSAYATCPLPPPQNRLAVRIEAGEKKPAPLH